MKNIILILIFLSFYSCQKVFDEKQDDINQIVKTIVIEDSLDVLKKTPKSEMLCKGLPELNVYVPTKRADGIITIPLPQGNISINDLMRIRIDNKRFFSTEDSLSLLNQNTEEKIFLLKENLFQEINFTTIENEQTKRDHKERYAFYQLTTPLFSKDRKKAYIQLAHHCGNLCGNGKSIFLQKINGKWKIVLKYQTWIS